MPKMETCLIDIRHANALRMFIDAMGLKVPNGDLGLRCKECNRPVKPHVAGNGHAAHFEHLKRNKRCSLSDV